MMETSTQVTLSWKEFDQCAGNAFKGLYQDLGKGKGEYSEILTHVITI